MLPLESLIMVGALGGVRLITDTLRELTAGRFGALVRAGSNSPLFSMFVAIF
jgi:hypothetical protein